jgi:hypothetical protein
MRLAEADKQIWKLRLLMRLAGRFDLASRTSEPLAPMAAEFGVPLWRLGVDVEHRDPPACPELRGQIKHA